MFYGVEVDGNTRQINKATLYTGGRYFLGLNHYFISFPRYNQYVLLSSNGITSGDEQTLKDSSVTARTRDGLLLKIDVAIDFQLGTQKTTLELLSQLLYIYNSVGYNWSQLIANICQGTIKDIISQYTIFEVPQKLVEIQKLLIDELTYELAAQNMNLNSVSLLRIEYPQGFRMSNEMIEVTQQENIKSQAVLNSTIVNSTIEINNANIDSQIIAYKADIKAQEIIKMKNSAASAAVSKNNLLFQSFFNFKTTLSLKDKTNRSIAVQLLTYYWLKINQRQTNNTSRIISLDIPEYYK